jgi:hypothetical protein
VALVVVFVKDSTVRPGALHATDESVSDPSQSVKSNS